MVQTLPPVLTVPDETTQQYINSLRTLLGQLLAIPFIQGYKLSNVDLTTSGAAIPHALEQRYQGAFALDGSAITIDTTKPNPEREIWISVSTNRTVDLWIY